MTVECLKNALALIENYFGRSLSTDERTARSQIYAAALKDKKTGVLVYVEENPSNLY